MYKTSALALILVLTLVASACSNEGDAQQVASIETESVDTSQETDTDPVADSEAAMLAFTQCLRGQGIDVDDPTMDAEGNMQLPTISLTSTVEGSDPGAEMPDFESIVAPCEDLLDGIVAPSGAGPPVDLEDSLLAYAQCMRSHGVDMPDPDLSSAGGMIDLGSTDGEEFEAADNECRPLLANLGLSEG